MPERKEYQGATAIPEIIPIAIPNQKAVHILIRILDQKLFPFPNTFGGLFIRLLRLRFLPLARKQKTATETRHRTTDEKLKDFMRPIGR